MGRSDAFTAPFSLIFSLGEARATVALEPLLADWGVDKATDCEIGTVVELLVVGFFGVLFNSRALGGVCDELTS
jgi:hypothetical protein